MAVQRRQMSRNAHRVGFGRVHQRMRRPTMVTPPPAPIGHNAMPEGDGQPDWLKERPMSDDWNNNNHNNEWHQNSDYQQHQDQHQGGQFQGDQTFQPQPEFQHQPEFHQHLDAVPQQHMEPAHEEPAPAAPSAEHVRLDAVEAAIQDLRNRIDEMKASLHAQAAAAAEPAHAETPATDPHADRLASIETEIGNVKALVTTLSQNLSDIHADVKSNAALHDETRGIVDEQHQLMRGLNYIITSAIGTLTTSAKTVK